MRFQLCQSHFDEYEVHGFTILRGVVPNALIQDLRRAAVDYRESAASDSRLGETAQWQLQPIARHIRQLRPFHEYKNLEPLRDALARLLTPDHTHANIEETAGLFFEPPTDPSTTGWHRDWTGEFPGMPISDWQRMCADVRFFNQGNCPLYQDAATWVVAGSHLQLNRPELLQAVSASSSWRSIDPANRERSLVDHARTIPGATQAFLEPGDYLLYRNTTWHTGIYMPYRRRATIFDFVEHPDYAAWRAETNKQWHAGRDKAPLDKVALSP